MPLLNLGNELLLYIGDNLESEGDINAFSQTNRRLHALLNPFLYRHNVQQSSSSGLLWAAIHGQEATARLFLAEGADTNIHDEDGYYVLQTAADRGNEAIVKLLLERGADVNAKGGSGVMPSVQRYFIAV
jgi:ankyrin repeat protein